MSSKGKIILIVVVVAIVVLVVGIVLFVNNPSGTTGPGSAVTPPPGNESRGAAPANIVVPDTTSQNVPANVAKPVAVSQSNSSGANYRDFNITIANNLFSPDTIISRVGDTVNVNIQAIDKDYDVWQPDYGWRYKIPKGQTVRTQFTGTAAGKFMFYCQSCGGPEKGPVGYFVIAGK